MLLGWPGHFRANDEFVGRSDESGVYLGSEFGTCFHSNDETWARATDCEAGVGVPNPAQSDSRIAPTAALVVSTPIVGAAVWT